MPTPASSKMRSWLFAPGDSARKMEKATGGPADIVILDLEDAVAIPNKPEARRMVAEFLTANEEGRDRLWVRINPLDGEWTADDLDAVMPSRPGGIVLPKAEGRHHVEQLDALLAERERAHGIEPGSTPVMALVTETAAAMFTTGDYRGAPRLVAMSWGAEDLSDSLGAANSMNRRTVSAPYFSTIGVGLIVLPSDFDIFAERSPSGPPQCGQTPVSRCSTCRVVLHASQKGVGALTIP